MRNWESETASDAEPGVAKAVVGALEEASVRANAKRAS